MDEIALPTYIFETLPGVETTTGEATWPTVRALLAEAYDVAVQRHERRHK